MGARSVEPDKDRIRSLRQERGWTAEALAKKAGCAVRSVGNAEAGKRIELRTLNEIAGALGVKPAELMKVEAGSGAKPEAKLTPQIVLSGSDAANVALLAELIAKTIQATGEITIKLVKEGSVIVTLEMIEADVLRLASLFHDFREHARSAIAATPEGKAYFSGSNPQELDLSKVESMLALVDRVRELRLVAEPDAQDAAPAASPPPPPEPPRRNPDIDLTPLFRALAKRGPEALKDFDKEIVEEYQRRHGKPAKPDEPTSNP